MAHKTFIAYFDMVDDAKEAMEALRQAGFSTSLDKIDRGIPDPNFSVSTLMVGSLPDLAHGIFGDGHRDDNPSKKDGAYLFVLVDQNQNQEEAYEIITGYDGVVLENG